jgi:catechol 2,3-dioxygenase-like lactoylglutathione lyase family enzyme
MTDKMRFEGLTLTVQSVVRSIEFYSGKLGLRVEWNAAPAFAMIRTPDGGTIGLLARSEARKESRASPPYVTTHADLRRDVGYPTSRASSMIVRRSVTHVATQVDDRATIGISRHDARS